MDNFARKLGLAIIIVLPGLGESAPLVVVRQVVAVVAHAFAVVAFVLVGASPRSLLDCLRLWLHL